MEGTECEFKPGSRGPVTVPSAGVAEGHPCGDKQLPALALGAAVLLRTQPGFSLFLQCFSSDCLSRCHDGAPDKAAVSLVLLPSSWLTARDGTLTVVKTQLEFESNVEASVLMMKDIRQMRLCPAGCMTATRRG